MIIETKIRYVSPTGTVEEILECDTQDAEGTAMEVAVEDQISKWFCNKVEKDFEQYYLSQGGDLKDFFSYCSAYDDFIKQVEISYDDI